MGLAYLAAQEERGDDAAALLAESEKLATETELHGILRWVVEARQHLVEE